MCCPEAFTVASVDYIGRNTCRQINKANILLSEYISMIRSASLTQDEGKQLQVKICDHHKLFERVSFLLLFFFTGFCIKTVWFDYITAISTPMQTFAELSTFWFHMFFKIWKAEVANRANIHCGYHIGEQIDVLGHPMIGDCNRFERYHHRVKDMGKCYCTYSISFARPWLLKVNCSNINIVLQSSLTRMA